MAHTYWNDVDTVECEEHNRTGVRGWDCKIDGNEEEFHSVEYHDTNTGLLDGGLVVTHFDNGYCEEYHSGGKLQLSCYER